LGEAEEEGDEAQASSALEAEDEEEGQEEAAQEGAASGGAEEGDEIGLDAVGVVPAQSVAQGGARDALLAGVRALGGGAVGVLEVVEGAGDRLAVPAEGVCARRGLVGRLRESHGSSPAVATVALPLYGHEPYSFRGQPPRPGAKRTRGQGSPHGPDGR